MIYSIRIQWLSENGEAKYFAFRRWLDIIILWQADWIPRDYIQVLAARRGFDRIDVCSDKT